MKTKRPLLIWLFSLIFLAVSFSYLAQAIRAIQSWNLLLLIQYRFGPIYPVFQGLLLASCFLAGAVLLFLRLSWAPAFNQGIIILAAVWYWLDRLVFSVNPRPFSSEIFALVFCLVLLILSLGGLWSLYPYMVLSQTDAFEEPADSSSSGGTNEQQ
jgi:hypothetical protein